jgi:hypothetical protein
LVKGECSYIKGEDLGKTLADISLGICSFGEGDTKKEEIVRGKRRGKRQVQKFGSKM